MHRVPPGCTYGLIPEVQGTATPPRQTVTRRISTTSGDADWFGAARTTWAPVCGSTRASSSAWRAMPSGIVEALPPLNDRAALYVRVCTSDVARSSRTAGAGPCYRTLLRVVALRNTRHPAVARQKKSDGGVDNNASISSTPTILKRFGRSRRFPDRPHRSLRRRGCRLDQTLAGR